RDAGRKYHARVVALLLLLVEVSAGAPLASTQNNNQRAGLTQTSGGEATSSRAARDEAVRLIPWKQMSPAGRQTAQMIVNNTSIYRRLPTRIIDCDPELFTFLLQHPEVVIDVWRVMGLSQVALNKAPDGNYHGTDGAGTTGTVRYLFSSWGEGAKNIAVIYGDG